MAQLWSLVYPAVRELCTSLSSPDKVAVLAADMVIQAVEQAERGGAAARWPGTDPPKDMVAYFGRCVFLHNYLIFQKNKKLKNAKTLRHQERKEEKKCPKIYS